MRTWTVGLLAAVVLEGCINIGVDTITTEQALANQVMGVLQNLGEDVLLFESVRGVDENGEVKKPPEMTDGARTVIEALQRQQFNRDDVLSFLADGSAREGNNGLLRFHETERCRGEPAHAEFVQAIVAEENSDRLVIMRRVIEVTEDRSEDDLPAIQKVFAHRNREGAQPGVWIQLPNKQGPDGADVPDSGEWVQKGASPAAPAAAPAAVSDGADARASS